MTTLAIEISCYFLKALPSEPENMELETTPQGGGERSFVLWGYDPNVDHYLGEDEEEDPDELDKVTMIHSVQSESK